MKSFAVISEKRSARNVGEYKVKFGDSTLNSLWVCALSL